MTSELHTLEDRLKELDKKITEVNKRSGSIISCGNTPTDNDGYAPTWDIGDRVWYDSDLDGTGHRHGPRSAEWYAQLRATDALAPVLVVLFAVGLILAVGLSWAHIWRRLSGQVELTDED